MIARISFVGVMLGLWFLTQKLIGARGFPGTGIQDKLHIWSAKLNNYLHAQPRVARLLLISSSLGIDLAGIYLLALGIFGASITPFLGLVVIFALRQLSQFLNALPPPAGMIWNNPGVPSLLVTYGVSNDLFFSGHTALAVYAGLQLAHSGSSILLALGVFLMLFEMCSVLVLRAHWTMDVYGGAVTALLVDVVARRCGPVIDQWLISITL